MQDPIELLSNTSVLEHWLLSLEKADEDRHATLYHNEATNKCYKSHYDPHINPHSFSKGDIVPGYDQAHDTLGRGKFESLWNHQILFWKGSIFAR